MATRSSVIQVEPDLAEAFNSAPEQQQERAKSAMRSVLKLVPFPEEKAHRLSKKETQLFLKINRTLTEDQQKQYDHLTEKRLNGTMTRGEYGELENLILEIERMGVERLQAVIELARLRKVAPDQLITQLEIGSIVSIS
ncbi:MAG: hypothetical protein ACREAB_00495 [Blastocatellia bacterium]